MNGSTFQVYDSTLGTYLSGTYSLSPDGSTVYFVPGTQLAAGRTYYVYFTGGMTDMAGNRLGYCGTGCLYNYSFTTGFSASTTPPQVTGVSPTAGLTKVPINAQVVVAFSEPVNALSLGGVTLSVNGTAVALNNILSSGNQLLTLTPAAALLPNKTYTLTVAAISDLSGNTIATTFISTSTTTNTADLTTATIISSSPVNGATGVPLASAIRVQISKPVDELFATAQTVKLNTR